MLVENKLRKKDLYLKYPDYDDVIEFLAKHVKPKYLNWVVKSSVDYYENEGHKSGFRLDLEELVYTIEDYDTQLNQKRHYGHNDIYRYSGIEELTGAVIKSEMKGSKRLNTKIVKTEGAKLIGTTENYDVYFIYSPEASRIYSMGTKWCLNSSSDYRDHFSNYVLEPLGENPSDLYFAIAKNDLIESPMRKLCYHFENDDNLFTIFSEVDKPLSRSIIDYHEGYEIWEEIYFICLEFDSLSFRKRQLSNSDPYVRAQSVHSIPPEKRVSLLKNENDIIVIKSIVKSLPKSVYVNSGNEIKEMLLRMKEFDTSTFSQLLPLFRKLNV